MPFEGVSTAIVTPFTKSQKVNFKAFKKLIDYQLSNNIMSITFLGTTGESATISEKEKIEILKFAKKCVNKRATIIAGAGSNDTKTSIRLCKKFEEIGVDALLLVTPYYNKCTQHSAYLHFKEIAKNTSLPIILYNVPSRTGFNLSPKTVEKLAKVENIVGIKEASGNLNQVQEIVKLTRELNFKVFSGDDALFLPILSVGGVGCISVASNVAPKDMQSIYANFKSHKFEQAKELQLKLLDLINTLFCEVNPIPVKNALNLMGFDVGNLRLPLEQTMNKENKQKLKDELIKLNLI